jgi:PmbA protein
LLIADANAIARKGNKVSSFYNVKHDTKMFSVKGFGEKLNEKTRLFLNSKKLKEKPKIVAFRPTVFAQLLNYSLLPNFNGKNVEKHKSLFSGKFGEKIIDKNISIFDNGLIGINSSLFDFEGSASKNTCLVNKGKLKGFVYDYNTAKNNNTESTGNAGNKNIEFSNVIIKAPKKDLSNALIIEQIMGAHTSNSLTTDFSVKVEHALNNGKPVKDFMISGKMIDVLSKVIGMDKDIEQRSSIITGTLASDKVNIIK